MNQRRVVQGMMGQLLGSGALLCAAAAVEPACAPAAAAPAAAAVATPAPKTAGTGRGEDGMQVEGGLGELDPAQVEQALNKRQPDIQRCYQDLTNRLWYLGGNAQIKLRVAQSGQPRSAAVISSSLGSYEVERCVAAVLLKTRFPAPKGGEGEFTYPIAITARNKVAAWPIDKVAEALEKKRTEIGRCQGQAGRPPPGVKWAFATALRLTFYVGPGGKITSVGLAADEPIDERVASCVVARVQSLHLADPLGQLVKVSYDLAAREK